MTPSSVTDNTSSSLAVISLTQTTDDLNKVSPESSTKDLDSLLDPWINLIDQLVRANTLKTQRQNGVTIMRNSKIQPELVYLLTAVLVGPGLLGNAWLLCMSLWGEIKTHSYSVYLCCASVTDSVSLVYVYVNMTLQVNDSGVYFIVSNMFSCALTLLVTQTAATMSPWIMVAFSCDRFIAIIFPFKRKMLCTVRNARIACVVVFVVCLGQQIPYAFFIKFITERRGRVCVSFNNSGTLLSSVGVSVNMLLPYVFLMYFNAHTLIAIRRGLSTRLQLSGTADNSAPNPNSIHPEHGTSADQPGTLTRDREVADTHTGQREMNKMTRKLLTLPVFTFVTFTPYAVVQVLANITLENNEMFGFDPNLSHGVMDFVLKTEAYFRIAFSFSFASNFYLLIVTSTSFRQKALKMLCSCPRSSELPRAQP